MDVHAANPSPPPPPPPPPQRRVTSIILIRSPWFFPLSKVYRMKK